jgi:selenocysteine lyase/cysteine desulfurase
MGLLTEYEMGLSRALLDTLESIPGLRIYGLTDRSRIAERVPTVSFVMDGKRPEEVAAALGEQGIYVWNGNYYALSVTERLGVEETGGMVRVGPVHYNAIEEIGKLGEALKRIAAG